MKFDLMFIVFSAAILITLEVLGIDGVPVWVRLPALWGAYYLGRAVQRRISCS